MGIIIRSRFSKPGRPAHELQQGELEAVTQELQEAYSLVTGRTLPAAPPEFSNIVSKFWGECLLSRSVYSYGMRDEEFFGTSVSIVTTAIMTAVATHYEQLLTESDPWHFLLNSEFSLSKYLHAADRPLRYNARATQALERSCELFEKAAGREFGRLFCIRKRWYDLHTESYSTKNLLFALEDWISHQESLTNSSHVFRDFVGGTLRSSNAGKCS